MPTIRLLPRSLDALPGESVRGYVLRLAHRLDRAPGRIAVLTGLGRALSGRGDLIVPAGRLLHLDAPIAATFAAATRLSAPEVAALCLDSLRDRYPPLDRGHQAAPHRKSNGAVATGGLASWVFTQSTRYCPQCLAGDGSAIQRAHGGAWQKLWHLPPRSLPAPSTGGCCFTSARSAASRSTPASNEPPACSPAPRTPACIPPSAAPRSGLVRTGSSRQRAPHDSTWSTSPPTASHRQSSMSSRCSSGCW